MSTGCERFNQGPFPGEDCAFSVAWKYADIVGEHKDLPANALLDLLEILWSAGPPGSTGKKGVSRNEQSFHEETEAPRCVSGGVQGDELDHSEPDPVPVFEKTIDRHRQTRRIHWVSRDRNLQVCPQLGKGTDVIEMGMGHENELRKGPLQSRQQYIDLSRRIDQDTCPCHGAAYNIRIRAVWSQVQPHNADTIIAQHCLDSSTHDTTLKPPLSCCIPVLHAVPAFPNEITPPHSLSDGDSHREGHETHEKMNEVK